MTSQSPSERAYEPGRLRRAAHLAVKHLGGTRYAVRGHQQPVYYVDLMGDEPCSCLDNYMRGKRVGDCKHILAARLASGDMKLVQSLGDMLLAAEKRMKEHTRRTRKAS